MTDKHPSPSLTAYERSSDLASVQADSSWLWTALTSLNVPPLPRKGASENVSTYLYLSLTFVVLFADSLETLSENNSKQNLSSFVPVFHPRPDLLQDPATVTNECLPT